jgi:hypothetical protein
VWPLVLLLGHITKYVGTLLKLKEFSIYDRSGLKVFTTTNIGEGWNGRYRGEPSNTSSFVYIIKGSLQDSPLTMTGSFIPIR